SETLDNCYQSTNKPELMKRKQAYLGMLHPSVFKWKRLPIAFLLLCFSVETSAQVPPNSDTYVVRGQVLSAEDGSPLPGVTVQVKGTLTGVNTDENGAFTLAVQKWQLTISFSYLGYRTLDTALTLPMLNPLVIKLTQDPAMLDEVIVSTAYESIPKERATGRFFIVDSALLHRCLGHGIVERLD